MLLRHPISRRGFLLGTTLAASQILPHRTKGDQIPPTTTGNYADGVVQRFVEIAGVRLDGADRDITVYEFSEDPDQVDVYIAAPNGVEFKSATPDWVEVGGHFGNGIWRNPVFPDQRDQGAQGWGTRNAVSNIPTPYDSSKNEHPTATGNNLVLTAADCDAPFGYAKTTLVVAVQRTSGSVSSHPYLRYVKFHFGKEPLPKNAIAPSASGITKRIYTMDDINWNALRDLDTSSYFTDNPQSLFDACASDIGVWGREPQAARNLRIDPNLTNSGYSADLVSDYAKMLLCLHRQDVSLEMKRKIAYRAVKFGLQVLGVREAGGRINGGAGQGGNVGYWKYAAAFLLDSPELLEQAKNLRTQTVGAVGWITESNVGRSAGFKSGRHYQTALKEQLGRPYYAPDGFGTAHETPYMLRSFDIKAWEVLVTSLWVNGPGGENGGQALMCNGPADTTNSRYANFAVLDWFSTMTPWAQGTLTNLSNYRGPWIPFYNALRDLCGVPRWEGRPDQIHQEAANFSGGDGEISWSLLGGWNFATKETLGKNMRYSLDRVSWIKVDNVHDIDSVSGLIKGTTHYCGLQNVSASGEGAWSPNFPTHTDTAWRNVVTTTGTETAAAPSYAGRLEPAVHRKLYPNWYFDEWEPVSETLEFGQYELAAGVGYPSGFPAPTYTFQWKLDGVALSGRTSQQYEVSTDDIDPDAGGMVSCIVTAMNSEGSASIETNAVAVPPRASIPAGVIFESAFGPGFRYEYTEVWETISLSNCGKVHEPASGSPSDIEADEEFGDVEDYVPPPGHLRMTKEGGHPYMRVNLAARKPLEPGKSYILEIDFSMPGNRSTDMRFAIGKVPGTWNNIAQHYHSLTRLSGGGVLFRRTVNINVSSDETDLGLWVTMHVPTSSGGTQGGVNDPRIHWARVYEVE